ncbi:MAG: DUF448 domain-containing protein [Alphaproteobacteria bacterium]|nr:DUF448 domain-containing protein [Alphaproteobacteria bacterium]
MTRTVMSTDAMLRLVARPDGMLVFDVDETMPGRGIWVQAAELKHAIDKKLLLKTARGRANRTEHEFFNTVADRAKQRLETLQGRARKAGIKPQHDSCRLTGRINSLINKIKALETNNDGQQG